MSSKNLKKLIRRKPKTKDQPKKNSKSCSCTKLCNCRAISWMVWQRVPKCCCTTKKCLTAKLQLKKSDRLLRLSTKSVFSSVSVFVRRTKRVLIWNTSKLLDTAVSVSQYKRCQWQIANNCVFIIEKNSSQELAHKFKIIDPDYEECK